MIITRFKLTKIFLSTSISVYVYIFNFVIHVDIQIISNANLKPIILNVKDKIDVVSIHIYLTEIPCHTMLYLHMYW